MESRRAGGASTLVESSPKAAAAAAFDGEGTLVEPSCLAASKNRPTDGASTLAEAPFKAAATVVDGEDTLVPSSLRLTAAVDGADTLVSLNLAAAIDGANTLASLDLAATADGANTLASLMVNPDGVAVVRAAAATGGEDTFTGGDAGSPRASEPNQARPAGMMSLF